MKAVFKENSSGHSMQFSLQWRENGVGEYG